MFICLKVLSIFQRRRT